jgi:hypothetical protein
VRPASRNELDDNYNYNYNNNYNNNNNYIYTSCNNNNNNNNNNINKFDKEVNSVVKSFSRTLQAAA